VHLVKEHHCCPNFLAQPIRREEKFGPTSKLAIYEHKCKHNIRTNRQISLALLSGCKLSHALVFSHLQLRPPRAPVLEDWAAHTEMIASHSRHLLLHCGATLCIGCKAKVMVFLFYQAIGILSSRQVFPMPALNRCMTRRRGLWGIWCRHRKNRPHRARCYARNLSFPQGTKNYVTQTSVQINLP
jgi:hypothetical protein